MRIIRSCYVLFFLYFFVDICVADQCAEDVAGPGSGSQDYTVLVVWGKTDDDASTFPGWANTIPSTLADFYKVMSYNQHTITTKVATDNGGFYVSDAGHTVSYYKNQFQTGQGYIGPWGIFVEEILGKVESDKGTNYFDDVDLIMMMVTDGGPGWYLSSGNFTGIAYLGVDYVTGNGKTFNRFNDGITNEFSSGESTTKYVVGHEYGHFLGFTHRDSNYGTYALMHPNKRNEEEETVPPLWIQNIIGEGWLDLNNSSRVQTVSSGSLTNFTLKPVRSTTGKVAVKVEISANEYFIINNHQQSTNPYDGTYPASGLLIWHIYFGSGDLECAVALNPGTYGANFDHLNLSTSDPNYNGQCLTTDFWKLSYKNNFAPWTNPNTEEWTGSFTDISVKIVNQSGNDLVLDIFINAPPGPPQNLVITNPGSDGSSPILQWSANPEPDLDHYLIWRGDTPNWKTTAVTWEQNPAANVTGTTWTDNQTIINLDVLSATYYRLTAVDDADNESDYSSSVMTTSGPIWKAGAEPLDTSLPQTFALHANYPNPFNPETEIKFELPEPAHVSLKIYNVLGEEVKTLVKGNLESNFYTMRWDGKNDSGKEVTSGIYIYRLEVVSKNATGAAFTQTRKMTLLR